MSGVGSKGGLSALAAVNSDEGTRESLISNSPPAWPYPEGSAAIVKVEAMSNMNAQDKGTLSPFMMPPWILMSRQLQCSARTSRLRGEEAVTNWSLSNWRLLCLNYSFTHLLSSSMV